MKQTIRLTESDIRHMVMEALDEYTDWKAEMLAGNKEKAQDLLRDKYFKDNLTVKKNDDEFQTDGFGVIDLGDKDKTYYSKPNMLKADENGGSLTGYENFPRGSFHHEMNFGKSKSTKGHNFKNFSTMNHDDVKQSMTTDMDIHSPEFKDFFDKVKDDMSDYYNDGYIDRLFKKSGKLGNFYKTQQDFLPKAIRKKFPRY